MGLIIGFLMGLLAAVMGFGLLVYWLCSRPNSMAVAKFINGIAQALAHKKSSTDRTTLEGSGSTHDALLTREGTSGSG